MTTLNIDEFHKKYCENYEWLYNGGDTLSEYEQFQSCFKLFMKEWIEYRDLHMVSDREMLAFVLTWIDMTV